MHVNTITNVAMGVRTLDERPSRMEHYAQCEVNVTFVLGGFAGHNENDTLEAVERFLRWLDERTRDGYTATELTVNSVTRRITA